MVKVYYNGTNAFDGICETPFVGISDQMVNLGQRWAVIQNINLHGLIVKDVCTTNVFSDLTSKQHQLFDRFRNDFKKLEIIDNDGSTVFSGDYAKINSIDFDQSPYISTANFKIGLSVYPKSLFSGTFGVTDPVSDIKYSEQKDGTVNITRNFSAKGFNTSISANNALENARSYVQSLTGSAGSIITPSFISSINPQLNNLSPRKIAENINRMESSYSVTIDYTLRKGATTSSVFHYTLDTNYEDEKGLYTVGLKGALNGTEATSMQQLRSDFQTIDPFNLSFTEFKKTVGYGYLNPIPDSYTVNENEADNVIDFSYSYTTDPRTVKLDYNIDIDNQYTTDQISVNFNGNLVARGPQKLRMGLLENELGSLNVFNLCQQYFLENARTPGLPLNINAKNIKITRDFTQSTINIQASFDNSQTPPPGFKSFTWSISITPSIKRFSALQFLNGDNGYFDLNYFNRGKVTVQGSAIIAGSNDSTLQVRGQALNILNQYAAGFQNRVRVEDKVDRKLKAEDNGYLYNFTITDSCETTIFDL